jgi:hypothetical protein
MVCADTPPPLERIAAAQSFAIVCLRNELSPAGPALYEVFHQSIRFGML